MASISMSMVTTQMAAQALDPTLIPFKKIMVHLLMKKGMLCSNAISMYSVLNFTLQIFPHLIQAS